MKLIIFPTPDGDVTISYPDNMSTASRQILSEYISVLMKVVFPPVYILPKGIDYSDVIKAKPGEVIKCK